MKLTIRVIAYYVSALVMMALLLAFLYFSINVKATENTVQSISNYLDNKGINNYIANIEDDVLSVKLSSTGDNYCTLSDVKAIQVIYEAIHAQAFEKKAIDVSIEIYNQSGEIIYNIYEKDVLSLEDTEKHDSDCSKNMTNKEILFKASDLIDEYPYSIEQSVISEANVIDGSKIELTLCESRNSIDLVDDAFAIYDELEVLSLSTSKITQCEITIVDETGECCVYIAGDYKYGDTIAWISPDIDMNIRA